MKNKNGLNDRLEEFVRAHREQFDPHEPDPSIWLRIRPGEGQAGGGRGAWRWLRVAAAVAVIFAGSAVGIHFLTGDRTGPGPYGSELYREIQETEAYYGHMVSQRYDELKPFLDRDPAAREVLAADMEELDQVYEELKEDLKDNASNPEVIEAMILNYRVKMEILEDLLHQLKEKENEKEEENGTSTM